MRQAVWPHGASQFWHGPHPSTHGLLGTVTEIQEMSLQPPLLDMAAGDWVRLSSTLNESGGITASRRGQKDLNSGHSWRRPCPLDMLHDDGNDDQHLTVSPIRYNRWSNFGTDLGHSYRIISIEHCHCLWCFGSNEWSWTSHMIK